MTNSAKIYDVRWASVETLAKHYPALAQRLHAAHPPSTHQYGDGHQARLHSLKHQLKQCDRFLARQWTLNEILDSTPHERETMWSLIRAVLLNEELPPEELPDSTANANLIFEWYSKSVCERIKAKADTLRAEVSMYQDKQAGLQRSMDPYPITAATLVSLRTQLISLYRTFCTRDGAFLEPEAEVLLKGILVSHDYVYSRTAQDIIHIKRAFSVFPSDVHNPSDAVDRKRAEKLSAWLAKDGLSFAPARFGGTRIMSKSEQRRFDEINRWLTARGYAIRHEDS